MRRPTVDLGMTSADRAGSAESVDVRRADQRCTTRTGWLVSRHSFAFGSHYDPANTSFGLLLASNDHSVAPGAGFADHVHRDTEVVTWVLEGALAHRDCTGCSGVVHPGSAQRMSAGSGVVHSERNAAPDRPLRFVQMQVQPDQPSVQPGYEQRELDPSELAGAWCTVASGLPRHADSAGVRIHQRDAALHVARLRPGQEVLLPEAPYLHAYLASGSADVESAGLLHTGDAVRITGSGGQRLSARTPVEVLVWEMHAALSR